MVAGRELDSQTDRWKAGTASTKYRASACYQALECSVQVLLTNPDHDDVAIRAVWYSSGDAGGALQFFLTNRSNSMFKVGSESSSGKAHTQRCRELECKFATFIREVMIDFDFTKFSGTYSRWLTAQYE